MTTNKKRVVVLDDDRDIAEIIQTILVDEGLAVSCLYGPDEETTRVAVEELKPDCVILDGGGPRSADPWKIARFLADHKPAIPTILLTGSGSNREEAMLGESDRARSSSVSAVVEKPFDIDRLIAAVRNALGTTAPSDFSRRVGSSETARLFERLRAAGAVDLQTSSAGREWITFRAKPKGDLLKIYRWQSAATYFIGRYDRDGGRMSPLAQLSDTDAVIVYCEHLIKRERPER